MTRHLVKLLISDCINVTSAALSNSPATVKKTISAKYVLSMPLALIS